MTLILIAWIINLRSVLGPDVEASAKPKTASEIDFEKFKNELNDTMNDVKDNLRDFKEIGSELVTDTAAPDPSASALDKFRDRLEAGQSPSTSAVTPATLPE